MDGDVPVQFLVLKTGFLKDRFCCSVSNSNSLRTKLRFESNFTVFIIVEYAAESLMFPRVFAGNCATNQQRSAVCFNGHSRRGNQVHFFCLLYLNYSIDLIQNLIHTAGP